MPTTTEIISVSKKSLWSGRIISTLSALFLGFDGILHLATPDPVVEAFARLGYPLSLSMSIGVVELVCIIVYLIPRTAVLGAILLTGYLGGAVSTHVRAGSSPFEIIFPILIGVLVWAGIFLREERLRALFALRG